MFSFPASTSASRLQNPVVRGLLCPLLSASHTGSQLCECCVFGFLHGVFRSSQDLQIKTPYVAKPVVAFSSLPQDSPWP